MSNLKHYWDELQQLETANQVIGYWEKKQNKLLRALKSEAADSESAVKIIHMLARSFNEREKYASVYYLHNQAYLPLKDDLANHELLGELKFELGRGLHHNGRFSLAKTYFNQLAATDFETSRIDNWWDQSAVASITNKSWIKLFILPTLGRFLLLILWVLVTILTKSIILSLLLFLLLYEGYEYWWQNHLAETYLNEFEGNAEVETIKATIRRHQFYEIAATGVVYLVSYFLPNFMVVAIGAILVAGLFSNSLWKFHYLSRQIGRLNREQAI